MPASRSTTPSSTDAGRRRRRATRLEALDLDIVSPSVRVDALITLARAFEVLGDLEAAVAILEPLLADSRGAHAPVESAKLANALVASYLEAGDLHRSVEVGERTLDELEAAGLTGTDEHLRLASTVLWAYVERGDILYATHRAAELMRRRRRTGSPRGRGSVYWNAALVAEQRRDFELAQRYTERALALLSEGEADRDLPRLRLNYAWLLLRSDPVDPREALDQIERAAPGLAVLGSELDLARVDVERSRAHLLLGDVDAAERYATAALERLGDPPRLETAFAQLSRGDALHARGDVVGAARAYGSAADLLGMMSASRQSASAWRDLGDRYAMHGDSAAAAQAYDRALREAGFRPTIPLSSWETWSLI